MRWIAILSLLVLVAGCSDKPDEKDSSTDNETQGETNNDPDDNQEPNNIACVRCGDAPRCGTECTDPCGCCCDEGEERMRDGMLQRCASNCWENVRPVGDAGDDADAGSDAGTDAADAGTDAADPEACTEQPNDGSPTADSCQHGAADWIVWKWVAPRDMTLQQIELHSDEGSGALLADDNDSPGTEIFSGPLSEPDADGWRTVTPDTPVEITGGSTYWIGEDVTTCSTVEDGTEFTYYTADALEGPWSGPFNAHPFTARLSGTCP